MKEGISYGLQLFGFYKAFSVMDGRLHILRASDSVEDQENNVGKLVPFYRFTVGQQTISDEGVLAILAEKYPEYK